MQTKNKYFLKIILIILAIIFINLKPHTEEEKKILILNSYHLGYEWTDGELDGIKNTLNNTYKNINIFIECLDNKRFSYLKEAEYFNVLKQGYQYKYKNFIFDGVIVLEDASFSFILKYQNELFPGTPIIFCGVNYFEDKMLEGRKNITGIVEFVDLKSAIDVIFEVQPNVKNIYFVTDLTLSSRINRKIAIDLADDYINKANFLFIDKNESGLSVEELLSELEKIDKNDAVFFADFFLDKNKKTFTHKTILPLMSERCKAPIYGKGDTSLGFGIIGGKLNSSYYHGKTAADLLIKALNGTSIKDIPVVKTAINKYMFDYNQLKRFNINEKNLPKDSIIINRPSTFYKIYTKELIAGLIIIILLIIFISIITTSVLRRKVAETSLSKLFESLPDMVKVHDLEGRYLFANEVACNTLGYTNEELLKMSHNDIDDPDFSKGFENRLKHQLQTGKYSFEGMQVTKNGEKIPVDINTTLINYHGKNAVLTVARDISERKKAEKDRENLLKKLELKNEELESIIYAASHDLKTPIVNIHGFSRELILISQVIEELLTKYSNIDELKKELYKILREDIAQSVKFITTSSLKMEQLLNGLLKVSRFGRVQLEITNIDMNNLISNIIDSMQYKIKEINASVTYTKLPKCMGDITQINQVFTNLIDNSLTYKKPNQKAEIKISGRKKDKKSIYCVEDNGIGIPKNKINRIFEIFYRFDPDINPSGEGIGLTIIKKILEQHNGNIWAKSEQGKGSKFYIALPNQ